MSATAELLARGAALAQAGKLDSAVDCFRTCVEQNPDWPEALSNLGNALREVGRSGEAIRLLERALRLRPGFPEALVNLSVLMEERGDFEEARRLLTEALAFRPGLAIAHSNLGSVLAKLGLGQDALASVMEALRLKPDFPEALHNLGVVLDSLGRTEEAIRQYREALRRRPDYADAHLDLGLALLSIGEFSPGFEEYEWRRRTRRMEARHFRKPEWNGWPLKGRTLLVHAEQGLGDTIQFVRYLDLIRDGEVILEVQPALLNLLNSQRVSIPALKQVVASGSSLPDFDCHVPLLSLPRMFRTTVDTIPTHTPYLGIADAGRLGFWNSRTGSSARFRAGLVWAGGVQNSRNRTRSMHLSELEPLSRVSGVQFFSLQKGAASQESAPASLTVEDLIADSDDIRDTAAAILNLDLIISVDTMVAHLAGALGKPVWTLLSLGSDWRWLRSRRDCPWYPTMRLFRQSRPGDWGPVVEEVREQLENLCHRRMN
jgi:tetratricopeptide (TPR) repeat protein